VPRQTDGTAAHDLPDASRPYRWQALIDIAGKDLIDPEAYKQHRGSPMAEVAEEFLPIDTTLRFALFGLECALGISFNGVECERIFREAVEDQVSAKNYLLFESRRLVVSGRVDEYEPESIWLRVQGDFGDGEVVKRVVDGAKVHALRLPQQAESEKHD